MQTIPQFLSLLMEIITLYLLSCAEPSFASVRSCQHSRLHKHSSSFDFSFEPDAWSFNLIQELNKIFKTC